MLCLIRINLRRIKQTSERTPLHNKIRHPNEGAAPLMLVSIAMWHQGMMLCRMMS
jgi:hypothetical protein